MMKPQRALLDILNNVTAQTEIDEWQSVSDGLFYKNIWAAAWQNQQNDLCTQRRLTQSGQSLRNLHEETLGT